ncbi:MAG: ornithine carbamoyltransferase [Candidatus Hydrothermarchaeales archaeon]
MDLISVVDVTDKLDTIFQGSEEMKKEAKKGIFREYLKDKSLAMIFEKPSTRTRVSFEAAMTQLGGHAIHLGWGEMQLGRGESLSDTAITLSKYVDGIVIRANRHADVIELGAHAEVPVINGLSDLEHPCQIISDLFTIREKKGGFDGVKLAYIGDGNNTCNSLMLGCAMTGVDISMACPRGYEPDKEIFEDAKKIAVEKGSKLELMRDPKIAVKGADIIYTDVWVSMGQEEEEKKRLRDFQGYQVDTELLKKANNPLIMHCLPAKRGLEITDDVLNSPNSIVFDQAENRLHVQKALLSLLLR